MKISPYFPHATVAPFVPAGVLRADALAARLDRLYARSERAPAVFASPLGPIAARGRAPLELTLALPSSWTPELYREAASLISKRLLLRYRGHQSFGQHI